MTLFLSIQNTYNELELALIRDETVLISLADDKMRASKDLIPLVNYVCEKTKIHLRDLNFIAVNQGPGPFTTLRVVIASVNGLAYGAKIPLVGIDGLDALLLEHSDPAYPHTIALLNAFTNDVYFGIQTEQTHHFEKGCKNIQELITEIQSRFSQKLLRFLGNGTALHRELIIKTFGNNAIIPEPLVSAPSIEQIGKMGLEKWNKQQDATQELFPIYLKTQVVKTSIIQ